MKKKIFEFLNKILMHVFFNKINNSLWFKKKSLKLLARAAG